MAGHEQLMISSTLESAVCRGDDVIIQGLIIRLPIESKTQHSTKYIYFILFFLNPSKID